MSKPTPSEQKLRSRKVFKAVQSLSKNRLEDIVLGVVYKLWMDDGEWNFDKEWDSDTLDEVSAQIPVSIQRIVG